jgi:hypothetical protein
MKLRFVLELIYSVLYNWKCYWNIIIRTVMANIITSSNTAPINAVIIYCTTVTTTFNILSRGKLFVFGARTDWPAFCCSYWGEPQGPCIPLYPDLPPDVSESAAVPVLPGRAAAWVMSGVVRLEDNTPPPRFTPGCSLRLLFLDLLFLISDPPDNLRDGGCSSSGHSLCRWPPPHHKQLGGCLQFAQTRPNCWQLWHWVRAFGALKPPPW